MAPAVTPAKRKAREDDDAAGHYGALLSALSRFFGSEELADIDFVFDDGSTFPGHALSLASFEYFRVLLLDSGLQEAQHVRSPHAQHPRRRITIRETARETFKAVLRYIYKGPQSIEFGSPQEAYQMFLLADNYGIKPMCEKLIEKIRPALEGMEDEVECMRCCLELLTSLQSRTQAGVWEDFYGAVMEVAQKLVPLMATQAKQAGEIQESLMEIERETLNDLLSGEALKAPKDVLVEVVEEVVMPWVRRSQGRPEMDAGEILDWSMKWFPLSKFVNVEVPVHKQSNTAHKVFVLPRHKSGLLLELSLCHDIADSMRMTLKAAKKGASSAEIADGRTLPLESIPCGSVAVCIRHGSDSSKDLWISKPSTYGVFHHGGPGYVWRNIFYACPKDVNASEVLDGSKGYLSPETGCLRIDVSFCLQGLASILLRYAATKFKEVGLPAASKCQIQPSMMKYLLSSDSLNVSNELSLLVDLLTHRILDNPFYERCMERMISAIRWPFIPPHAVLSLVQHSEALMESSCVQRYISLLTENVGSWGRVYHGKPETNEARQSYALVTRQKWPTSMEALLLALGTGVPKLKHVQAGNVDNDDAHCISELEKALAKEKAAAAKEREAAAEEKRVLQERIKELEGNQAGRR